MASRSESQTGIATCKGYRKSILGEASYAAEAGHAKSADSASSATKAAKLSSFDNAWTKYSGGSISEGVYLVRTFVSDSKGPIYSSVLLDTGKLQNRCATGIMDMFGVALRVLATYAGSNRYTLELQRYTDEWKPYPEREYDFEYKQIHAYAVS